MRFPHRTWVPIAVVVAVGILWSCATYDTSLLLPAPPDAAEAAVVDEAGTDAGTGCKLAQWPRRPSGDDVPGGGTIEFVNSIKTID
jgi:hypothetical protein